MARKLLKSIYSVPVNQWVLAFCLGVLVFYIGHNWGYGAEKFYHLGFAKFLVFSTVFYVLLMLRIYFYTSIAPYGIVRVGEETWMREIRQTEKRLAISYFLVIFILLPCLNGVEDWRSFWLACLFLMVIWWMNYCILSIFLEMKGKELWGAVLPLLLLAIYTYVIFPWLCRFF